MSHEPNLRRDADASFVKCPLALNGAASRLALYIRKATQHQQDAMQALRNAIALTLHLLAVHAAYPSPKKKGVLGVSECQTSVYGETDTTKSVST